MEKQVLGSFERRLGRDNATDKEGEAFTDTSIHVLLLCNFLPSFEKWFLEVSDSESQILCIGGQTMRL